MALFNKKTGHYIKIDPQGNYIIYANMQTRTLEKQSTSAISIKFKYDEIIKELHNNYERKYYDPNFIPLITRWEHERTKYLRAHFQGLNEKNNTFPLMLQYIPDIENSLPEIVSRGSIGVPETTLQNIYIYIKESKLFGEVEDC